MQDNNVEGALQVAAEANMLAEACAPVVELSDIALREEMWSVTICVTNQPF